MNLATLDQILLTTFPYFQQLKEKLTSKSYFGVISELTTERFDNKQIVFCFGDVGRKVYFVMEGNFQLFTQNNDYITTFVKGHYFGEVSLTQRVPRTGTVICTSQNGKLLSMNLNTYNRYIGGTHFITSGQVEKCQLFDGWSQVGIELILHHIQELELHSGNYIYKAGQVDNHLYIVKKGEVRLKKGTNYLVTVGEGDYFGEYEILNDKIFQYRQTDAISSTVSTIFKIDSKQYQFIAKQHCNKTEFNHHRFLQDKLQDKNEKEESITFNIEEVIKTYISADQTSNLKKFDYKRKNNKSNDYGKDMQIELLNRISFAIPFRENPLCNIAQTLRTSNYSNKKLRDRLNKKEPNEWNKSMKIFTLNKQDRILLQKRLQDKFHIQFPKNTTENKSPPSTSRFLSAQTSRQQNSIRPLSTSRQMTQTRPQSASATGFNNTVNSTIDIENSKFYSRKKLILTLMKSSKKQEMNKQYKFQKILSGI